jgi:hypothetical protein
MALEGVLNTPSMRREIRLPVGSPAEPPKAVVAPSYELAPIPRISPFPFEHSLLFQPPQLPRTPTPPSGKRDSPSVYSSEHGHSLPVDEPNSRGSSLYGTREAQKDYQLSITSSRESGNNPLSTEGLMQDPHARRRHDSPVPLASKSWSSFLSTRSRPERKRSTLVKRPPPTSFRIVSKPMISNPTPITTTLPPGLSAIKALADPGAIHATRYPEPVHPSRRGT